MRDIFKSRISKWPKLKVVAETSNAQEVHDYIDQRDPDVITLDIKMPDPDGVQLIEELVRYRRKPVIVVFDDINRTNELHRYLMQLGAHSCIEKFKIITQNGEYCNLADQLQNAALRNGVDSRTTTVMRTRDEYRPRNCAVAIGASTGGVDAIAEILLKYPKNCPPTLITQHMPARFCLGFTERLNRTCLPLVKIAEDGEPIKPGSVLLAPGGENHLSLALGTEMTCRLWAGPKTCGHRPSVDELFYSFSKLGARATGVLLTGMGRDGAVGLLSMRQSGALTIGQDEDSSIVYGMPKAAVECGAVQRQLRLDQIAEVLLNHCKSSVGATDRWA